MAALAHRLLGEIAQPAVMGATNLTQRTLAISILCTLLLSPFAHAAVRRHVASPPSILPPSTGEIDHVLLLILENTDAAQAMRQPFLAQFAASGASLTNYHGLAHPSQPNYIALTAGSAYGITNDNPQTIDVPHLGDLLEAHGRTWKAYAEQYPGGCFLGDTLGTTTTGRYVREHVPFLQYADVTRDPLRCANVVNADEFDGDVRSGQLPSFALYVPDTVHDGHDSSAAVADAWLQQRFSSLLADPHLMASTLFVIVFDESANSGTNNVYAAMSGAGVQPGFVATRYYDHYDLLRTIEEIFHLGTLGHHDSSAAVIAEVWRR